MIKKITWTVTLLLALVLVYLMYEYYQMQNLSLLPADKVKYLKAAADNFCTYGFIICFISWVNTNITAVKTNSPAWLWIPFVFTVWVSCSVSYQAEDIFLFNKANGMWKGGFSLSYFVGIGIILIAAVALLINYFIVKAIIKKRL